MEAPSFTGLCSVWTYFTKVYVQKNNTKKTKFDYGRLVPMFDRTCRVVYLGCMNLVSTNFI